MKNKAGLWGKINQVLAHMESIEKQDFYHLEVMILMERMIQILQYWLAEVWLRNNFLKYVGLDLLWNLKFTNSLILCGPKLYI